MEGIKRKNKNRKAKSTNIETENKSVETESKSVKAKNKKLHLSLPILFIPVKLSAFICVNLLLIFLVSCQSKPTDMRSLAPAETVIYLETKDLGETLAALTESPAFTELAKNKPDFSPIENVQAAIFVAGFESSAAENDDGATLNFKPRFVAVADTHRWNFSAARVAEDQIGALARAAYGETVRLEKRSKPDADFFVWTNAADKRKIFAAVSNGVIYVGTDENLIDKCLAVKRGAAENLLKNENLARAREKSNGANQIAFGYVSPEGVERLAEVAAVATAVGATDDEGGRSFIARLVPPILQKTTREISWTARKNGQGIEDAIFIQTSGEVSALLNETRQPSQTRTDAAKFLPADVFSATRYDLKNPQTAWRGLLFTVAKQTDTATAGFLAQFSGTLLEPFGISDADRFLGAIDSEIFTARVDEAGEKSVAVVTVKDSSAAKKSLGAIDFGAAAEKIENGELWKSEGGETAAAFVGGKLIVGDADGVSKCLAAERSGENFTKSQYFQRFRESRAAAVTFTRDADSTRKTVEILGGVKDENQAVNFISLTETSYTENGIERRYNSAFGLIGSILERF